MYCKKCGKKLESDTRFCKRCGSSVNGESAQKAKKREIEKLSQNRIERNSQRKNHSENKKKKNYISENGLLVLIISAALIILVVFVGIGYSLFPKDQKWNEQDGSVKINETPTPSPTAKETTDSSKPYTITENANEDGYKEFEFDGKVFLYPSGFAKTNSGDESRLKLADSSGDGVIELKVEPFAGDQEPRQLMMDFARNDSQNEVESSTAGDDWYDIDLTTDVDVVHKKCVFVNGEAISYTFTYPRNSKYESLYKQHIEYMDEKFSY